MIKIRKYLLFLSSVDTAVSGWGHFQDFRPGFRFWHIFHVDRHGHFTLKQLRLPVLNETHTNIYTGPRLSVTDQLAADRKIKRTKYNFTC